MSDLLLLLFAFLRLLAAHKLDQLARERSLGCACCIGQEKMLAGAHVLWAYRLGLKRVQGGSNLTSACPMLMWFTF